MKYLFHYCMQCEKEVLNLQNQTFCPKCGHPFITELSTVVQENEWIAIRLEEEHCFLIGTFEDRDKAIQFAVLDYGKTHRKEPFTLSVVTAIPNRLSTSEMLQYFYGIELSFNVESELRSRGTFQDKYFVWKVGLAKELIL